MQARFLGRQWRKTNMDVISAIYTKVRHRLNDDWAFANDTRYTKTDHQVEEAELAAAIKRFNTRRYRHILGIFHRYFESGLWKELKCSKFLCFQIFDFLKHMYYNKKRCTVQFFNFFKKICLAQHL